MKTKKKIIEWVCDTCGITYGRWYQPGAIAPKSHCATYHIGTCDMCDATEIPVTEPRDFGHLINDTSKSHAKCRPLKRHPELQTKLQRATRVYELTD